MISSLDTAQSTLDSRLPVSFARLRATLKPLLDGHLDRVIYVSYGNPALNADGGVCASGREGFDIHPAFGVDGERLQRVAAFVENRFFPRLKALATCSGGTLCGEPVSDRMTFVDSHQASFGEHGFCAHAEGDPPFDRECFSPSGESFAAGPLGGTTDPLLCRFRANDFRTYAPRARWIRTANDSYFAAMTFPEGVSATLQPSNLHDAAWGVLSAVYGGAIHPTAEGHAAMADAAVAAAANVLQLAQPVRSIMAAPLPDQPAAGSNGELPPR
jgi:hypothetical protein